MVFVKLQGRNQQSFWQKKPTIKLCFRARPISLFQADTDNRYILSSKFESKTWPVNMAIIIIKNAKHKSTQVFK